MKHADNCGCHDHDDHHHHHDATPRSESDATYRRHGVRFVYPGHWKVEEDQNELETTISVQSDGVSYWSLTVINDAPDPTAVVDTVIDAYRGEYQSLDVYEPPPSMTFHEVVRDLDFMCVDMVNSAKVKAFRTNSRTLLVVYQGPDREMEQTRSLLENITASLHCEEGMPLDE